MLDCISTRPSSLCHDHVDCPCKNPAMSTQLTKDNDVAPLAFEFIDSNIAKDPNLREHHIGAGLAFEAADRSKKKHGAKQQLPALCGRFCPCDPCHHFPVRASGLQGRFDPERAFEAEFQICPI